MQDMLYADFQRSNSLANYYHMLSYHFYVYGFTQYSSGRWPEVPPA